MRFAVLMRKQNIDNPWVLPLGAYKLCLSQIRWQINLEC